MEVLVVSDFHIIKETSTGTYWCMNGIHGYDYYSKYLGAFEKVLAVARVMNAETIDKKKLIRADGDGVEFIDLPFVRKMKGYAFNYFKFHKLAKKISSRGDCAVFIVPALPTFMILNQFKKRGKPYALEVIVDPETAFSENFIAKTYFVNKLKKECQKANGVSYVTRYFLENKYPSKSILNGESEFFFNAYYSSLRLSDSFFGTKRIYDDIKNREIRIIHVCNKINSDIKGHGVLLKIVRSLVDKGIKTQLTCVGDGDRRLFYEEEALRLKIDKYVNFTGGFSDKKIIRDLLMNSDIMVFPTKAEGLPRVLIEAMSTGLPCLSTPVNGIPELLEDRYMFRPDDVDGFTNAIIALKENPRELEAMSEHNIELAKEYRDVVLQARRIDFFKKLKNISMIKQEKLK